MSLDNRVQVLRTIMRAYIQKITSLNQEQKTAQRSGKRTGSQYPTHSSGRIILSENSKNFLEEHIRIRQKFQLSY